MKRTREDTSALYPPSSSSTSTITTLQSSSLMDPEIVAQDAEMKKLEKDLEENSNEIKNTSEEIKKQSAKIERIEDIDEKDRTDGQKQDLTVWRKRVEQLGEKEKDLREKEKDLRKEKERLNEKLDKLKAKQEEELTLETVKGLFPDVKTDIVYQRETVFVGREKEIQEGVAIIHSNCDVVRSFEAARFAYPLCAGLPGIGKTTLICKIADAYRIKHENENPDHLVKIGLLNLSNGGKFWGGVTEAGVVLQVLSAYFTPDFVPAQVPKDLKIRSLADVLKLIEEDCQKKGKKKVIFLLIFDEFQELIDTKLSLEEREKTLREMCSVINGEFTSRSKPVWIQPMFAGTLDPVYFPQKYSTTVRFQNLQPLLLTSKEIFAVVDEYKKRANLSDPGSLQSEWRLNQRFVIDLLDLGPFPRILILFLEACFGSRRLEIPATHFFLQALTFDHTVPLTIATNAIKRLYNLDSIPPGDLHKSLLYSVTGLHLPLEDKKRLEIVSTKSFLLVFGESRVPKAQMSHHLLLSYVNFFPVSFARFTHYFTSLDFSPKAWERFNVEYLAFRINALINLGETKVALERLFQGAWGTFDTKKLEVKLKEVRAVQSATQITSKNLITRHLSSSEATAFVVTDGDHVVQNASGAPFADGLLCLTLAINNSDILVALQEKLTVNAEELKLETIMAEIEKNKVEGRRVLTVFLSNRPTKITEDKVPKDCLVICKPNLKEYYGCFQDVPLLHLAGSSVMVNYATFKQVQELIGVGEATAEKIVKAVPIRGPEDLKKITEKEIEGVSYFPYDI